MADVKEQYDETIRQLVPIFSLSPQYQNQVIKRSQIIELRKGTYLFHQGDRDEFSFYLLAGELEMKADGMVHSSVRGGSDSARYPLAQLQPRQFSARAAGTVKVLRVNRNALDKLLVVEQRDHETAADSDVEVNEIDTGDDLDWMTRILQSELFSRLPTANIHQLFTVLEAVEFQSGDWVIEQDGPGDYYYIIKAGRCEVLRHASSGGDDVKLAELGPGDGFGEEALLTNAQRNAGVRMLTDGVLMRMNKDNFLELIKKPALSWLDYADACRQVAAGAEWLDVRLPEEHEQAHIENSRNLPMATLRADTSQLTADKHYIIYCDSGGRSSVAAFLLTQKGFRVSYLDGGLMNCPGSDLTAGGAEQYSQAQAVAESAAGNDNKVINADVRASAYTAEVAVSSYEMETAASHNNAGQSDDQRAEYEAMAEKLRAEHARLEAAKQRAAEEAQRHREEEESRIEKLRAETEQQLQEQKKKLEAVYAQNAEEMERLRSLKQQAEAQIKAAQDKAEADSAEAQRRMQEADAIKQQLYDAKAAIENEAKQQREQQAEMEKEIQAEAMRKLEAERKNLADQYQRSSEALEQAQREKIAAEAARKAANEEAQHIIAEFKAAHAKTRAEEEAKLKAERDKLEQQSREIRESMDAISKAKEEAEAARQAAEMQLAKLKIKVAQNKNRKDDSLQERVKAAEAQAQHARAELSQVNEAEQAVQSARESNVRGLKQQSAEEQKLRAQIENEVSQWLEENELEAPSQADLEKQAEHMRRIKERSEAAKRASQYAAHSLLDDIANQLDQSIDE